MTYEVWDAIPSAPEALTYDIEDTPEADAEWRTLLSEFENEFKGYEEGEDFEFPDWHYKTRALCAYLYNEEMYNPELILKTSSILRRQRKKCFASFECYGPKLIGYIMVLEDKVIFDTFSKESGLMQRILDGQNWSFAGEST